MSVRLMPVALGTGVLALGSLGMATAQEVPFARYGGIRDRFRVSAGAFFVSHDAFARAPLPMFGAGVDRFPGNRFVVHASGQYLGLKIGDTLDGHWGELKAAVEWSRCPRWAWV